MYNKILLNLIEQIKTNKTVPTTCGAYKYCYTSDRYVILQDKTEKNIQELISRKVNFYKAQQLNKEMIEFLIETPKLLACEIIDDKFYELQERAMGSSIFLLGKASAYQKYVVRNNSMSWNDKIKKQDEIMISCIEKGNLNSQKSLIKAPQNHYDKLVGDMITLNQFYRNNNNPKIPLPCDSNPENILYSPLKGFTFIDLDYDRITTKMNDKISDYAIPLRLFSIFSNSTKFCNESFSDTNKNITYKNPELIKSNNVEIVNKLLIAFENNKLNIKTDEPFINDYIKTMIGNNELPYMKNKEM